MIDRTRQAVECQLKAMGAARYEVGIHSDKGMLIQAWTPEQVMKSIGYLKGQNARGAEIYIRPHRTEATTDLVLVDDVDQETLERMTQDGLNAALVTETSPGNHQAWIRVPTRDPKARAAAARMLAHTYGGDPASADAQHFGRLGGFTNRKAAYRTAKGSPFVLVRQSSGKAAEAGEELVRQALQSNDQAIKAAVVRHAEHLPLEPSGVGEWYRSLYERLQAEFGTAFDASRADWLAAVRMFRQGHDYHSVANAVAEHSPEIAARKAGHVGDYVLRTVGKAEVWVELERQGAAWKAVSSDLLDLAKARAQERQQHEGQEPSLDELDLNKPEYGSGGPVMGGE